MQKVLITGATGFLGSNLVRILNERKIRVRILRRAASALDKLTGLSFEDFAGELGNAADFRRAAEGCDTVFYLAACTSLLDCDKNQRWETNVRCLETALDVLLTRAGTRLVYCSSVGAIGFGNISKVRDEAAVFESGGIDYFVTKKKAEERVLDAVRRGLDAVIVNPATIIGVRGMREVQQQLFRQAVSRSVLAVPPGGTCIVSAEDVVRGMLLAAEKGKRGERYILGGENLSYRDYFSTIARAAQRKPAIFVLPGWVFPFLGAVLEVLCKKLGRDTGYLAKGFGYYSSRKAECELEYQKTPLADTLQEVLASLEKKTQ
jgi:dihydroflavonol-4-reductase